MIETKVTWKSGVQFDVEARGHQLICDQPLNGGGDDAGLTPPELMLASLATCAGYYAVQYLKVRNLSLAGLTVRVEAEKAMQPARLGSFTIIVDAPSAVSEKDRDGVRRSAEKCLIHATLLHPPTIHIEVRAPVSVA